MLQCICWWSTDYRWRYANFRCLRSVLSKALPSNEIMHMNCYFEGQTWVFSFLSPGVLHLAVQRDIGAAKLRKHCLTRGDQNSFCKSDPNVDGVADVRIDRWILQEWSHTACRLTRFQWDQVVRPGCTHAVVTYCCSGQSFHHMSRAVAWQSRHESVCVQPVSFTVRCTRLWHTI